MRALPQLDEVFWVLAGDVFAPDFMFTQDAMARFAASGKLGHIWLVPNPPHHPGGDFGLSPGGLALNQADTRYTFSTIALYRRALFEAPWCDIPPGNPDGVVAPLAPLLRRAIDVIATAPTMPLSSSPRIDRDEMEADALYSLVRRAARAVCRRAGSSPLGCR